MSIGLGVAAVALVATLCVELRESPDTASVEPESKTRDPVASGSGQAVTETGREPATTVRIEEEPHSAGISKAYSTSRDYYEFAESIADRARSGDANAQYYLYAALSYCDEIYRAYFRQKDNKTRTLDEALNRVSTRQAESVEVVRTAHSRCARLFDGGAEQFGVAADWLRSAAAQNQPLALTITAVALLLQGETPDAAAQADAKSMFITALKSKDPEVVWRIGEAQTMLNGGDERNLQQWSWWLAACRRGFDCENSRWLEFSCRFDQLCAQDRNAIDYIRRSTELDFPEVEARATQINADIDSERWDSLGLSPCG